MKVIKVILYSKENVGEVFAQDWTLEKGRYSYSDLGRIK